MTESEDEKHLRAAHDPRRAYRVEETPPELVNILIPALDRLINDLSIILADESAR